MPPVSLPQAFALAQQHHQAGRWAEAEHYYRQILAVAPQHTDTLNFLGVLAAQTNRHALAIDLMRQSLALAPHNAAYHDNLGTVFREVGRPAEAAACHQQAIALDPREPASHHNLGNALQDQYRLTEAIAAYDRALTLAPDDIPALIGRAGALSDLGLVREAIATYRRALAIDPQLSTAHSAVLHNLHYLADTTPEALRAEHARWNEIHARPLKEQAITTFRNDPAPERRLRIGYVSPDFRHHPVAYFFEPLLASHDRRAVEVFCYSNTHRPDPITARLQAQAEHWREITHLTDAAAAALIREDRIDILVDLAGHTADHRLLVLARQPAPIQASAIGYCDTTGLDAVAYRFTDHHVHPTVMKEDTGETLVRLPVTFACYRPPNDAPAVASLPASRRGFVTFASFHTLAKLGPELLAWWAQILTRVPQSRLLFVAVGLQDVAAKERLQAFFTSQGITPDRLEFRGRMSFPDYLATHGTVDILLDSHPFSGHTTSCHALWMGVPVVTLADNLPCSRMVASVLHNAGLSEWIARSPAEYVQLAATQAGNLPRLAEIRSGLRDKLAASSLTDAPHFAQAVETACREMWQRWCASQAR